MIKWPWTKRIRRRDKPTDPDMPWLPPDAVAYLDGLLSERSGAKVLEFGCGGSTVWFSRHAAEVLSFEHDPEWHRKISERLIGAEHVALRLAPRPYYDQIDALPAGYFDVVLIDGRDRLECARHAIRVLAPTGVLLFDDMNRTRYVIANKIFAGWPRRDFFGVPDKKQKITTAWQRP